MAAKYAVNCFFAGFSDIYTSWHTPGVSDFSKIVFQEKKLSSLPIEIGFSFFDSDFDRNSVSQTGMTHILFKKNEKTRPLVSKLSKLKEYGKYLLENFIMMDKDTRGLSQRYALPLIASFSTHGIHKKAKIDTRYFLEYKQSPTFGYYLCANTDGLSDYWVKRLLTLTEAGENPLECKIVTDSLRRMFGERGCNLMDAFQLRILSRDIYCRLTDGREVASSYLSDGYRRLFSIVIDIAFRCALLNGDIFGAQAAQLTHGTVIIDEIDQHLHPTLQAVVVKGLQNAFPNLQFIISTHAPMVMSGVESNGRNCVKYMAYDADKHQYHVSDISTYGMDISTISRVVLNQTPRDSDVENRLGHLSDLISENDLDNARHYLSQMKREFGDRIPELSRFETEINFEEALR